MIYLDYIIVLLLIGLVIFLFVRLRIKRGGSTADLFITSYGATDAFFHNEQKNAIETIADSNANKKLEDQSDSDPKTKSLKKSVK
jgi:hypothetical protein